MYPTAKASHVCHVNVSEPVCTAVWFSSVIDRNEVDLLYLSLPQTGSHGKAGDVQPGQRVSLDEADKWVPVHRIHLQPSRHGK